MSIASNLRARAEYMRKHGFSPHLGIYGLTSCCFIGSATGYDYGTEGWVATNFLEDTLAVPMTDDCMIEHGWNTDDAIAALEIAADIAECEGR